MEEMTGLLAQYGLALVFVNVFLTQVGAPVPAIPTLVVAGALAQRGELSAAIVLVVAIGASLLGDLPWFIAGRIYGSRAINVLCRISIEPETCVKQTENIFERWGAPSLIFAKFVPGFSIVAPPIAGAMQLAVLPFFVFSAIGAAVWAGVAVGVGMVFHAQVDWVIKWLAEMGPWAALVIGSGVVLFVAFRLIERWLLVRWLRMARISVDELHEQLQRADKPVILDARSSTARKLDPRRVPGARAVDLDDLERHLAGIPPEREVVIYCT
jgi:membrane protein DedA with SNARE-associated domain